MSARSVPEWIGNTPDSVPPARVRLRVFDAHGGRCYLTRRKIMPGDAWELDHVRALVNGGENRESNLAPALKSAHRIKTNADVAEKAHVSRMRMKHLGIKTSTHRWASRGFGGGPTKKQQRLAQQEAEATANDDEASARPQSREG